MKLTKTEYEKLPEHLKEYFTEKNNLQQETYTNHNAPKGTFAGGELGRGSDTSEYREQTVSYQTHPDKDCVCHQLDEQSGYKCGQAGAVTGKEPSHTKKNAIYGDYSMVEGKAAKPKDELAGASRFFKQIKHHPDCVCHQLDEQSGTSKSCASGKTTRKNKSNMFGHDKPTEYMCNEYGDQGGASRFFKQIKHHPDCVCHQLDEQSGNCGNGHWAKTKVSGYGEFGGGKTEYKGVGEKDRSKSGASKFFKQIEANLDEACRFCYCPKVSTKERNIGLENEPKKKKVFNGKSAESSTDMKPVEKRFTTYQQNTHPTVKPMRLMEYLIRLITPPNGWVLDPFAGSGSTLLAAKKGGWKYIGIEKEKDYVEIARKRLRGVK